MEDNKYFLLTFYSKDIEVDILKNKNIDSLKVLPIDIDTVLNLDKFLKDNNINFVSLEEYNMLKNKVDLLESYIKK